ncbi:MAG: acetyl-CoA hydrolase/transferase C-terminal domain-containing protein, partial [Steroidobacteraceae bacterium]
QASSDLEQRLVEPLVARIFGSYPELEYLRLTRDAKLPPNIRVIDFFLEPGKWLNSPAVQRDYLAANYTHVARDLAERDVNVIAQLVASRSVAGVVEYSLGSNPDVTLDLLPYVERQRAAGRAIVVVGAIHAEMPFMLGAAVVPAAKFDLLLQQPRYDYPLYAPPNPELSLVDHAIGVHASALVRDGGTLQIGIGELGDALCYALLLRHQQNAEYRKALHDLGTEQSATLVTATGGRDAFRDGLFGSTEMFVDQMLDLLRAGILRRKVYDWLPLQRALASGRSTDRFDDSLLAALVQAGLNARLSAADVGQLRHFGVFKSDTEFKEGLIRSGTGEWFAADLADRAACAGIVAQCLGTELRHGTIVHAAFLLGPRAFYVALNNLPESERALIDMRGVGYINQLYGDDYLLRVAQRAHARHVNTTMMVTTLGAAISDSLDDGRVVSGVGGQYNFVAMAHALPGGRSILCVRATRTKDGVTRSNIVSKYGGATIPRHLRDIIITEYGIADLRGRTDGECAAALIGIADSRFQDELLQAAKRTGKLPPGFILPAQHRNNTPAALRDSFRTHRRTGRFPPYPFGTDLTSDEIRLGAALRWLANNTKTLASKMQTVGRAFSYRHNSTYNRLLTRLQLESPHSLGERVMARLVEYGLRQTEKQD